MLKKAFLAFMDHFESYLCQMLLVFFVLVIFMQIVLRAIGNSLPWTEEIARFAFIWFILFGACYATRLCALNRVTVQFLKAPQWVTNCFLFVGDVLWLIFAAVMAYFGYMAVLDLQEFPYYTPALDWDLGYVYLVFPLSFTLMCIRIIQVNVMKYILKIDIADPDQESMKESQRALGGQDECEDLTLEEDVKVQKEISFDTGIFKRAFLAFMDHFESYLCQILLVFFVLVIFMQIVLRAIGNSLPWTEEIARFAFIWFILFGACYATRLCALNRVTVQFLKAPQWVTNAFLFVGDVLWLIFAAVMAYFGYMAVLDLQEFPYYTPALDWDLGYVYLVFPLSFTLMCIRIIQVNVMKYILKIEIADPDQESMKESQKALADTGGEEIC